MKQRVSGAKTTDSLWVGWNLSQASLITPDSSVPGVETSRIGGAGWRGGWGGGEGTDSEVKTKNKCRNSSRLKKPERNVLASADVDQAQVLWERLRFFLMWIRAQIVFISCLHAGHVSGRGCKCSQHMHNYHSVAVSDSNKDVGYRNVFFCDLHHELS